MPKTNLRRMESSHMLLVLNIGELLLACACHGGLNCPHKFGALIWGPTDSASGVIHPRIFGGNRPYGQGNLVWC